MKETTESTKATRIEAGFYSYRGYYVERRVSTYTGRNEVVWFINPVDGSEGDFDPQSTLADAKFVIDHS